MAPCSTALKYFQYPAGEWDSSSCLLSSFRSCRSYSSFHSLSPHPPSLSLSFSFHLSIRLSVSLPALLRGCLFPEFIHASWWRGPHYPRWMDLPFSPCWRFAPLLEILVAWRFSILLPFLFFFYLDHLLPFLKSLFTRRVSEETNRALLESNVLWLNIRTTMSHV